jgi:hypothetical protein
MDNNQALGILFQAARMARLSAEEHAQVEQAAKQLQDALPKEDKKKDDK